MCGIVGFNFKNSELLEKMLDVIKHRGPDDSGTFENDDFSLGHVRLSILDLSRHGHQPMKYENLHISYNGEVYNYKAIRKELISHGYEFKSETDTEVVLKAYHKWGIKAVDKFIGMFAIAIYDTDKSELILIRDRVGIKPLYYYFDGNTLIFTSELKALLESDVELKISEDALCEFFQFGYISSNLSIFENCYKLSPGHYLTFKVKEKSIDLKEYWSILPFFERPKFSKTEEELTDELEELLIDAFKYRMVSDVPVGIFLSGGIDSSLLAAILQKHHGNINTFTIGFKEEAFNEAGYAKQLAEHIVSNHTEKIIDISDAKDLLNEFPDIYSEPLADCSGIPTVLISRLAKKSGVKVVLSADGGDELCGGYQVYEHAYKIGGILFKIPLFIRKIASFILSLPGTGHILKNIHIKNFAHKYHQLQEILTDKNWNEIYEKIVHSTKNYEMIQLFGRFNSIKEKSFRIGEKKHPIEGMMLWDFHRYLVDDILTKVDSATMSASIEGRTPLLDHRIAEFLAQVPFDLKHKNGDTKYLFRKVLERYIPENMMKRPKMGFGIPVVKWFREDLGDLLANYLAKDKSDKCQLNYKYLHKEYQKFKDGETDNVNKLWFTMVYEMWHAKYMKK